MPTFNEGSQDHYDVLNHLVASRFFDVEASGTTIEILTAWATKPGGKVLVQRGHTVLVKVKVTSAEDRTAGYKDVRIVVDGPRWSGASPRRREAILAEALYSLDFERMGTGYARDDQDRPVITIKTTDWEISGFQRVLEWYGEDSLEQRGFELVNATVGQKVFPFAAAEQAEETAPPPPTEKVDVNAELVAGVREVEASRAAESDASWRDTKITALGLAEETMNLLLSHDVRLAGQLVGLGGYQARIFEGHDDAAQDVSEALGRFRGRLSNAAIEDFDAMESRSLVNAGEAAPPAEPKPGRRTPKKKETANVA